MVTVFQNIFSKKPYFITIEMALDRIKTGKSKALVESIRNEINDEKKGALKKNLPCVLFSGKFQSREDVSLQEHSGMVILDFDHVEAKSMKDDLTKLPFIYACWVSPGGEGIKALVKIADPKMHRQHLKAIYGELPKADPANINEARVCYESWDPEIYINDQADIYTKTIEEVTFKESVTESDTDKIFVKLQRWIINSGNAFQTGERNLFIYKLASACCRFGIQGKDCMTLIAREYLTKDGNFKHKEAERTIHSAYKSNHTSFGSAHFENERAITTETRNEIDPATFNASLKPKDVIYGMDVAEDALAIYRDGFKSAETTHVPALDEYFKWKRGELTVLTGIGNYGKSSYIMQLCLIKSVKEGTKWAFFSPETNPAEEFYHDLVEQYVGCNCTPSNPTRPSEEEYLVAYNFIAKHFFYIYPKEHAPTPQYIKERFLELVIKEKVSGVIVDPFNNLSNDYKLLNGREDKYLEAVLGDFLKFAQLNYIFFVVIAHPRLLHKNKDGSYSCPDVMDLSGGAMWNNRSDNILVYHRPKHHIDPNDSTCQHHSKKIRRQKIVGKKGVLSFDFVRSVRRFYWNGFSPLDKPGQAPLVSYSEPKKEEEILISAEEIGELEIPF